MEETREIRVEIPKGKGEVGESGREIRVEVPADVEFSEEEIRKIAAATENEIVDVIRGAQAKQLAAKTAAASVVVIRIRIVRPQ